jgi:hypothetical protein
VTVASEMDDVLRRMVIATEEIDPNRMIFDGIDTTTLPNGRPGPTFSVGEVAKVFFGRTGHWIRWCENKGKLTLDGKQVGHRTTFLDDEGNQALTGEGRPKPGYRYYTLADVEAMAHALAQHQTIDGGELIMVLATARNIAVQWKILG